MSHGGFTPTDAGYIETAYEYPDQAAILTAQCSSAPAVLAARTSGEEQVRAALTNALEPYRNASGGYRLQNEYRYLTAARAM